MRTRELMRRNTEAFERFSESMDRHAEAADRAFEAADRAFEAAHRASEAGQEATRTFYNQRDVMRSMIASVNDSSDVIERRSKGLLGSFADLAAEIRRWRNESGPGRT